MAADQRYCLGCGKRRGEPRLPVMDAVVFIDAIHRQPAAAAAPPAPAKKRARMSPNASLIAGVGTLLLALGIGVLIGQTHDSGTISAASSAPQIIRVGGGGGEEEATASPATGTEKSGAAKAGEAKKKAPENAVDSSGTSEAAAEVLKPAGDVKLPPPTVKPGGKCESGASGCENGEFTGDFFGE